MYELTGTRASANPALNKYWKWYIEAVKVLFKQDWSWGRYNLIRLHYIKSR